MRITDKQKKNRCEVLNSKSNLALPVLLLVLPAFLLLLKFLVYLSLVVFFYTLLYTTNQPVLFFLAYTAYGLSAVLFGFNYAHDCSHNTVFKSKKLNSAFFIFIYVKAGIISCLFWI